MDKLETQGVAFAKWVEGLRGKRILLMSHARPDGDSVGSLVAATRLLGAAGVTVLAVNPDPVPRTLRFLTEGTEIQEGGELPGGLDGAILVDCADAARIGRDTADKLPPVIGNIDHHVSNQGYAEMNLVIPDAAATAEILLGLALGAGWEVDLAAARALYAGIMTDTGSFRYANTTPRVFAYARELCRIGVSPSEMADRIYENETFGRMKLLARFLSRLDRWEEGRVCCGYVTAEDYRETGTHSEDVEGFSSYTRAIEGVELGLFLEFKPEGIKGSLRASDPSLRVDLLAREFGGGGHAAAAGFNIPAAEPEEALGRLREAIHRHLQQNLAGHD